MTVFQIMIFALSLCFLVIVICTVIDTIEMRLRHPNTKFDLKD